MAGLNVVDAAANAVDRAPALCCSHLNEPGMTSRVQPSVVQRFNIQDEGQRKRGKLKERK